MANELDTELNRIMDLCSTSSLFGLKVYNYEIFENKGYLYADKILYLGKDCVYTDNETLTDKGRTHYFDDFNETWFISKFKCIAKIKENGVRKIIDEDK